MTTLDRYEALKGTPGGLDFTYLLIRMRDLTRETGPENRRRRPTRL